MVVRDEVYARTTVERFKLAVAEGDFDAAALAYAELIVGGLRHVLSPALLDQLDLAFAKLLMSRLEPRPPRGAARTASRPARRFPLGRIEGELLSEQLIRDRR